MDFKNHNEESRIRLAKAMLVSASADWLQALPTEKNSSCGDVPKRRLQFLVESPKVKGPPCNKLFQWGRTEDKIKNFILKARYVPPRLNTTTHTTVVVSCLSLNGNAFGECQLTIARSTCSGRQTDHDIKSLLLTLQRLLVTSSYPPPTVQGLSTGRQHPVTTAAVSE